MSDNFEFTNPENIEPAREESPSPVYNNAWHKDEYAPRAPKPEKKKGKAGMAIVLVVTVLMSGALGFGGGLAAMKFFPAENVETSGKKQEVGGKKEVTIAGETIKDIEISEEALAAADASAFNAAAVAAVGLPSVVEITTEATSYHWLLGNYATGGAGSGVIIKSDGYIVTNHHVIDGASKITVRTRDGKEHSAELIGSDKKTDLAVIKIEGSTLPAAEYGKSASLVIGQPVLAIGNPLGELGGTVTQGIVSATDREILVEGEYMNLIQTDASISPGNSGGGLFDGSGNLIGVVNAKYTSDGAEGLGFAIPIDTAKGIINEIMEYGYVTGRPEIGIQVTEIDERTAKAYELASGAGIYIYEVMPGGAAEAAGLAAGDKIISVAGVEITVTQDIADVLEKHKAGDTITIKVSRDGEKMDFKVTLKEKKPE